MHRGLPTITSLKIYLNNPTHTSTSWRTQSPLSSPSHCTSAHWLSWNPCAQYSSQRGTSALRKPRGLSLKLLVNPVALLSSRGPWCPRRRRTLWWCSSWRLRNICPDSEECWGGWGIARFWPRSLGVQLGSQTASSWGLWLWWRQSGVLSGAVHNKLCWRIPCRWHHPTWRRSSWPSWRHSRCWACWETPESFAGNHPLPRSLSGRISSY